MIVVMWLVYYVVCNTTIIWFSTGRNVPLHDHSIEIGCDINLFKLTWNRYNPLLAIGTGVNPASAQLLEKL